jgi:hypothetical protein
MNGTANTLTGAFTKNRTEELDLDVWEHFVIPPFYADLDLLAAKKPRVIIGGRGTGKTMLLRYLSHYTMFSRKRPEVPEDAVAHIGLYLRADTQFAHAMEGRGIEADTWSSAFEHLLALLLAGEVVRSLSSIADSKSSALTPSQLEKVTFSRLATFDSAFAVGPSVLPRAIEDRLWEFEMWVSNVRKRAEPAFLPGRQFILALINEVRRQVPSLVNASFCVYLDEYENLALYQQKLINTYVKHSTVPLIFHLAMKRHAFRTRETVGNESISDIADFREVDLEELLDTDFEVFAAEILFLNLILAGYRSVPVSPPQLRDPSSLVARSEKGYREQVLKSCKHLFPQLTSEQLAKEVFKDTPISRKLLREIQVALETRASTLSPRDFYRPHLPMATIVSPALIRRPNLDPNQILDDLNALERGEDNRFTGKTDWIHNNFVGCLLMLYEPHSRVAPFYAGYGTFCNLARGNLRYLLELCHKSWRRADVDATSDDFQISPRYQAEAARETSAAFLGEVRSFGKAGNRLYTFVLRLGSLFALAHRRPTQSEAEVNHFSISRGDAVLDETDLEFLREAAKWSVVFEEKETKVKDEYQPAQNEYVLNPIYAPYFNISYRKRRRLDLSTNDLLILIRGTYQEVRNLLKRFSGDWSVDLEEADPTLFHHLLEE